MQYKSSRFPFLSSFEQRVTWQHWKQWTAFQMKSWSRYASMYVTTCPNCLPFVWPVMLMTISFKTLNIVDAKICHPLAGSTASATRRRPRFSIGFSLSNSGICKVCRLQSQKWQRTLKAAISWNTPGRYTLYVSTEDQEGGRKKPSSGSWSLGQPIWESTESRLCEVAFWSIGWPVVIRVRA